jgi:class 3 adenylate cyclase
VPDNAPKPPPGVLIPIGPAPWSEFQHYPLRRDKTTIGRAAGCDIRINFPSVSRVHAELNWLDGAAVIRHLSSVNPTLVNGLPVVELQQLRSGDLIEIAEGVVLRLERFADDDAQTEQRRRDQRRMFTIVCTDVVGYTRLVENDDVATARQLEACFSAIRSQSEAASGRVLQVAGDGMVLLFTSAASALNSTIAWQRTIALLNGNLVPGRRMEFRVGINSGDLLLTPVGGTHGDAINIAARLQAMAQPGGILVTGAVRDQLQMQEGLRFEHIRSTELKNVTREVRIYRVSF